MADQLEIAEEIRQERAERILEIMPALLAKGCMVWCRNGEVTLLASPCEILCCKYKGYASDIPKGPSCCQMFQITEWSDTWERARHVAQYGDVTPFLDR